MLPPYWAMIVSSSCRPVLVDGLLDASGKRLEPVIVELLRVNEENDRAVVPALACLHVPELIPASEQSFLLPTRMYVNVRVQPDGQLDMSRVVEELADPAPRRSRRVHLVDVDREVLVLLRFFGHDTS